MRYSQSWTQQTTWDQPNLFLKQEFCYNQGGLYSKHGFGTETWGKIVVRKDD